MGKLTISMAMFNSYVTNHQRVNHPLDPIQPPFSYGFPMVFPLNHHLDPGRQLVVLMVLGPISREIFDHTPRHYHYHAFVARIYIHDMNMISSIDSINSIESIDSIQYTHDTHFIQYTHDIWIMIII